MLKFQTDFGVRITVRVRIGHSAEPLVTAKFYEDEGMTLTVICLYSCQCMLVRLCVCVRNRWCVCVSMTHCVSGYSCIVCCLRVNKTTGHNNQHTAIKGSPTAMNVCVCFLFFGLVGNFKISRMCSLFDPVLYFEQRRTFCLLVERPVSAHCGVFILHQRRKEIVQKLQFCFVEMKHVC